MNIMKTNALLNGCMTFLASIHVCVNAAISVGGLPVNYTSAEHDRKSTQKTAFLRKQ